MAIGVKAIRDRLYADFMMPSRLDEYERLLTFAQDAGYQYKSIEGFWRLIRDGAIDPAGRYLVLRHDLDTDPATAGAMWAIDRRLGVQSSYFFRLSTLDIRLMRAIADGGGDAGYHFEELATIAKQRRIRDRDELADAIPQAQELFLRNLERLRIQTGLPIRVVASHGDFVNRKLGVQNAAILDDPRFRLAAGVDLEINDESFMAHVSSRHSDTHHPRYWIPDDPDPSIQRGDPEVAIRAGYPVVYLLIHPRHWRVSRSINAREDVLRLWEGLEYRLPSVLGTRSR